MMRSRTAWTAAALLCLSAGALANVAGSGVVALDDFARDNPRAGLYMTGQRVTSVYGPAFSTGATAEESVNGFLARHAGVFGVGPGELVASGLGREAAAAPIGVMPDGAGGFKFTLHNFKHEYAGLPVFRSQLKLLVRNADNFPMTLARSTLRSVGGLVVDEAIAANPNTAMAKAVAQAAYPVVNRFTDATNVIFAGDENTEAAPRLAVQFYGFGGDKSRDTYEAWLFVSDAATGELLFAEDQYLHADMAGKVSGLATDGPGADFCHTEVSAGMPYARVTIGATNVFADVNGDFLVPNVAGGTLTVTASIAQGQHFRLSGATSVSTNVAAPGPANLLFNGANTEAGNAQVNCYLHANIIRDLVLQVSPGFPVEVAGGMNIFVNIADVCNAGYDPVNQDINFFASGGGCPNTGFSSVVYHEYGHHLVSVAGSGQGGYGEGAGDSMSVLILDDPVLGRGWSGSCSSGLRNAVNTQQAPCSGVHACAPLLSGAIWDTRNALLATNPSDYLEILTPLFVNSILLHTGSNITSQITIDLITLDDDDADITNGSPHYSQINQGFTLHNLAGPAISALAFSYPDGLPTQINPNGETVQVRVTGNVGNSPSQNGAILYVDTNGDNVFEQHPMQFVSSGANGNIYNATFPSADCAANVRFYVSANTTTNVTVFNPTTAPAAVYSAVAATDILVAFDDDFETNQGWTAGVPGDTATTGQWTRVDPVGTAAQPENDFDADGTVCFVTGQGSAGGAVGTNDIDGGFTTLLSPMLDATGGAAAYVSYARWYSNHAGDAPNADTFTVQISDDNGGSWTTLEVVGPTGPQVSGGWFAKRFRVEDFVDATSTVRLRFIASDLGSGSIVEAAVDAVTIETYDCTISCVGDLNGDLVVDFGDLNILLGNYSGSGVGDLNDDGDVDFDDLNMLLGLYGQKC